MGRERSYVELFSRERSTTHSRRISLHNTDHLSDHFRRDSKAGADTTYCRRGRSDEWVGPIIQIQHEGIGSFHQDLLLIRKGFMDVNYAVDDKWFKPFCEYLKMMMMRVLRACGG